MRPARAALFLLNGDDIALIERHREGRDYWIFPGGGLEPGETPSVAAIREAHEELGLDVRLVREVLELHERWFGRDVQHFFLAEATERRFGEMSGPELAAMSPTNRYRPAWIPLQSVPALRLLPVPAKQLVVAVANGGDWPAEAQIVKTTDVTR